MNRKPYTGGPLNKLNGLAGISAPYNSVPVSGLIRAHNPKSANELEQLIEAHTHNNCECKIVSKGSVRDFGYNLYNAQREHWGEYRFSLKECIQWEYDLFIIQMLKGNTMEEKCKNELAGILGEGYNICNSSRYVDEDIRVDLEVILDGDVIAGIQVKPESFNNVRSGIRKFNESANEKYGKPVFYITYNYDTERFNNIKNIAEKIGNIVLL